MPTSLHPVRVHIKNFQSIDDLEFEVSGFTCITGRTNIGKSAIMRAMSRALLNDPVTGMVRKGQKFASVEMSSEGWGFLWEKGEKDVNRYQLLNGKILDKTGQVQPKEIQDMGFHSIRVGDDDLEPWWAPQVEPVFLLNKSGPQITNFISEVSRLQVYQNAIVLAAKLKRRQLDDARTKAEELAAVQDKLNKLTGVSSLEKLEDDIEEQIRSLQEYVQRAMTLEDLHKGMESVAAKLVRAKEAAEVRVKTSLPAVEEIVDRVVKLSRMHLRLKATARKIIASKSLDSVVVPELHVEEVSRLRKAVRLLGMSGARRKLERAEKAAKVKIPDLGTAEAAVQRVLQGRKAAAGIARASLALENAGKLPRVPELYVDEAVRVRALWTCYSQIVKVQGEIVAAEAEEKRLLGLKKKVEKKMAALQVCPECGQKLPEHTHAKGRKSLPA